MTKRPVAIDLFSGAGGMTLGFERAGFDVLAAIDSDPVHLAVHERNFPHTQPVCASIADLAHGDLVEAINRGWARFGRQGTWDGEIDCVFGGPSCQGFSDMGQQRDGDARNQLVLEFARVVVSLRPKAFVMENVPGFLFTKYRPLLEAVQHQLARAGYLLLDTPLRLDAADFGVPQHRRRVFLVGVRAGLKLPSPPSPMAPVTVAEALDSLPNVSRYKSLLRSDALHLDEEALAGMMARSSEYARSLRRPNGFEYPRVWDPSVMSGCGRTVHSDEVKSRFRRTAPGEKDPIARVSRLKGSGQSMTLRAGAGRDHGSYTAPRPIHHRFPRVVTVREAARLHSFPDWFSFNLAKWHALREIGNSVPPALSAAVAETVVAALGLTPIEPTAAMTLGGDDLLTYSLPEAADHFEVCRSQLPPDVRRTATPDAVRPMM